MGQVFAHPTLSECSLRHFKYNPSSVGFHNASRGDEASSWGFEECQSCLNAGFWRLAGAKEKQNGLEKPDWISEGTHHLWTRPDNWIVTVCHVTFILCLFFPLEPCKMKISLTYSTLMAKRINPLFNLSFPGPALIHLLIPEKSLIRREISFQASMQLAAEFKLGLIPQKSVFSANCQVT